MDKVLMRILANKAATYKEGNDTVNSYINNKLRDMLCRSIENYLSTYWHWNMPMEVRIEIPLDFSVVGVNAFKDLLCVIRDTYGCSIKYWDEVIDYNNLRGKLIADISWDEKFRNAFCKTMRDRTSDVDYFDQIDS